MNNSVFEGLKQVLALKINESDEEEAGFFEAEENVDFIDESDTPAQLAKQHRYKSKPS